MERIEIGRFYIHIKTGVEYLAFEFIQAKIADGEWTHCVIYSRLKDGQRFVRDVEKFKQNFREKQ